jgi:hypothetical protein
MSAQPDPDVRMMYVNQCLTCTLAQAMRVCAECRFNIGLPWRIHRTTLSLPIVEREAYWQTLPKWQWEGYVAYGDRIERLCEAAAGCHR